MPLVRAHHAFDDQFAQIPNDWLRDSRLSLKAIGLLAQTMSHRPGWNMSIRSLANANKSGRDSIASALKELVDSGYLVRTQERDESNRWAEATYTTSDPRADLPVAEKPLTGKPLTGKPLTGNDATKNTITKEQQPKEKQTKELSREDKEFEEFWKKYPRHEGSKAKAKKAYWFAVGGHGSTTLWHQLDVWLKHPSKTDRKFWPYLERWLRDERFLDELNVQQAGTNLDNIKGYK